jgi:hypothetical protein
MRTATEDTALVWHVEPAESWPAGDLLGDEPAKLVPEFNPADLTDTEQDIRDNLREMGRHRRRHPVFRRATTVCARRAGGPVRRA